MQEDTKRNHSTSRLTTQEKDQMGRNNPGFQKTSHIAYHS